MKKRRNVIDSIAMSSIQQHRMYNRFAGMAILVASFLLSFSMIFIINAAIDVSDVSGLTTEAPLSMLAVVIIIICAVRIAVSSILYASAMQRTHEYATLQLIGMTHQQISQIVRREEQWIIQRYIPAGLVLGVLLNLVLPIKYYLAADIVGIILAGLFIYMTVRTAFRKPLKIANDVSPVEAIKPTLLQQIPRSYKPKSRTLTAVGLAFGYIGLDRKKSCYTFLSLILSGVLMFSVFSIVQAINVKKLASYPFLEESSIYISYNTDYLSPENDYSYNDLMKNSPFTEQLLQDIEAIQGVSNVYQLKSLSVQVINPDTGEECEIDSIESILSTSSLTQKLADGELPIYSPEQTTIPVVLNRTSLAYKESGMVLEIGDHLAASIDTGNEMRPVTLIISGFIEDKNMGTVFLTNEKYLENISEMNCNLIWYITTEKSLTEKVAVAVSKIVKENDRMSISILENVIDDYKAIFHNFLLVIVTFVALISSFSIINLVNTCITNVFSRQYDYVLLEAIGMTKKQLFQMQFIETAVFLLGGFIGSCVAGIPIGAWLCTKIANLAGIFYVEYSFPIQFMCLYLLASCITLFMLFEWQKSTGRRKSIVERLKLFAW